MMISRYIGWFDSLLLLIVLAIPGSAGASMMRVSVLPVPDSKVDRQPSREVCGLIREVLADFDGVDFRDLKSMDPGLIKKVRSIIRRCGSQRDCQAQIARLMKVQVFILVDARSMGDGMLVNLEIRDMGTGRDLRKLSRTMAGSSVHKKNVLNEIITQVLFPERMVGRVELKLEPDGADVYLDGQLKVRAAPASVNLESVRSGQHTLQIKREGYRDFIAIIQVPFKGVSQLNVSMQKALATKR